MIKIRSFFVLPNYYISTGVNRMIKGFKSFPQLFVYKDEDEEESDEDQEGEMEIGLPTDVKHVAHIGWDGACTTINPMKGWENLEAADILSLSSSISLRDFEIAMNAQNSNGESVCTNKMVQKIVDGKN
ncbi:OLC1v1018790C1 [Oldenlandia corymbosa var. corymbosa]|nr:OLC1v1018790C1 [Oldenlandia corymbosa var. corymbosa]